MLKEQILKTLRYFDIQDHPLTLLEIHKYLLNTGEGNAACSVFEIESALKEMNGEVGESLGFYFISGRNLLAKQRWENNFYSTPRLRLEKKYLPRTRHIPFVSAVALTGSEALNTSKKGSDIDLLVFARPNRIWLARFFTTAYFQLTGLRRSGNKVENRFCLNHYIREGKNIDKDRNVYTAIEYASLIPYFGVAEVYKFQKENLDWMKNYLVQPQFIEYPSLKPGLLKRIIEILLDNFIGDGLDWFAGALQKKRIKILEHILVEDDELSFHPDSKGKQVLSRVPFKI